MSPVIMLEFNELTPVLMDRFIAAGKLPGFAKLRARSAAFVTDAEEDPPYLEPWIQWITVHTGLGYKDHGIFDLGDGPKLTAPRIWDMLSDENKRVWICGSMNASVRGEGFKGRVLPDPWATGIRPIPDGDFDGFLNFVQKYVQEYTRDKAPVTAADSLRFLRFMTMHGLSAQTVTGILRQLLSEARDGGKWRRATILDRLQWDVFKYYYRREAPDFSTFFLNSTAHFQHYYWRNLQPDSFDVKPSEEDQARYEDAILYGYQQMDEIVSDCLDMAGETATIVMCTALGSQPMLHYEESGGVQLFRAIDPDALFRFAGIDGGYEFAPVMAEEFRLFFEDEAGATAAMPKLLGMKLESGEPLMKARQSGREIYAGCSIFSPPGADVKVRSTGSNELRDFYSLFYPLATGIKSGMHHRDGLLWISRPGEKGTASGRKVLLREVAPTLLALCGHPHAGRFSMPPIPELGLPGAQTLAA